MNRDWTGELQVIILSAEINYISALFRGSNWDAFLENEDKIHERECLKKFFLYKQINYFRESFQGF